MTRILGIVLIVAGFAGLIWGGVTYKSQKKLIDVGPIHATHETTHHVPISPIAGGLALVGGIALLAVGGRD